MSLIIFILIAISVAGLANDYWKSRTDNRWKRGIVRDFAAIFAGNGNAVGKHSPLWRELDRLTKSRAISERLVARLQFRYPGKSQVWYLEKALYDLKRDRRV